MKRTRRAFLRQASSGSLAWLSFAATGNDKAERRTARWIEQYDRQGLHRTGTAGDKRSADWLAAEVGKLGVKPLLESFALDRVDPLNCFIEIGGKRIEGLPLFDAAFTDANGVRGKLGAFGGETELGLIELPPNAEYGASYEATRRTSRHRALLVITKGARAGLCPINSAWFNNSFGSPALQVGSEHGEWLKRQAQQGARAHIVAHVKRTKTKAHNVTATINGAHPRLAPLVVMTPRSGWWHSTSERGGGLVCWLEVMGAVAAARPARHCLFVASSGHEIGHLGLDHFIEQRRELVKDAHVWIHLGANIGARDDPGYRLQTASDKFDRLAIDAMKAESARVDEVRARDAVPFGEAGNIHRGGGRYISMLGRNGLFHHRADRWPDAVDAAAVAAFARAFVRIALTLAKG